MTSLIKPALPGCRRAFLQTLSRLATLTTARHRAGVGAVLIALLVGCAGSPPAQGPATGTGDQGRDPGAPRLTEQRWNLLLFGTRERIELADTPFFRIDAAGRVSGFDGCNRFSGAVELGDDQHIEFKQMAATRKACPDMDDVQRVTAMLTSAYRYLIDHDRLTLFGADSRVLGGWRRAD